MGGKDLTMLFNIREYIENCEKVPFSNKSLINREELLQLVEEVIRLRKGETNE